MTVLITGASRGIGFELVKVALEAGHKVIAVSRSAESLSNLQLEYKSLLQILNTEITTATGREKVFTFVQGIGSLDVLFNNAGVLTKTNSEEDLENSFLLNATVPFLLTEGLLPFLKKSTAPRVVQISTMMSSIEDNSSGGYYAYRSSKSALNMITKSLSVDHPEIRFGLIHPGWVKTEMGGTQAPVLPTTSAQGIWKVTQSLELKTELKLQDYLGKELFW